MDKRNIPNVINRFWWGDLGLREKLRYVAYKNVKNKIIICMACKTNPTNSHISISFEFHPPSLRWSCRCNECILVVNNNLKPLSPSLPQCTTNNNSDMLNEYLSFNIFKDNAWYYWISSREWNIHPSWDNQAPNIIFSGLINWFTCGLNSSYTILDILFPYLKVSYSVPVNSKFASS